ncbi:MAG: orotidine-5'-phosphate decarboxylase [Acidimicrobiales bacterium]
MAASFASRFASVRSKLGPLVWGLDPSARLLAAWGLEDSADGLGHFADIVVEAAAGTVGMVKPQSAFFERHGWRGARALERLIRDARSADLLVVLDVKRGDVGTTNEAYADAFIGSGAPLQADAVTVHPYLGLAALGALASRSARAGSCLLVVARSSNPEGRVLQQAVAESGRTVEEELLAEIGTMNAVLAPGEIGPIGAVVSPTQGEEGLDLAGAGGLFLAPGLGAQGSTCADVARVFAACPERVMPSASRLLLAAGPDVLRLRDAAAGLAAELRQALAG